MKRFSYTLILLAFSITAVAQNVPSGTKKPAGVPVTVPAAYNGINLNYIRTWEPSAPIQDSAAVSAAGKTIKDVKQSTAYLDGLGRPIQAVVKGASPGGRDLVTPVVYDALGRELFKYLPYTQTTGNSSDGEFKQDPFNAQKSFFESPTFNKPLAEEKIYYTQNEVEASPLGRVLNSYGAGNSWAKAGAHPIQQRYEQNTVSDSVRKWVMGAKLPVSTDIYPAGELFKNVVIDEAGSQTVEFKDKENRVICKRVLIDDKSPGTAHMGWLNTYYAYDDEGQLRFVIPPLAVEKITNNWDVSRVDSGLCFQYRYDIRNRLIVKRVPGTDSVETVFDVRNRAAFMRDGNLRIKGKWLVTFYDDLNRPVETALYNSTATREALQASMENVANATGTQSYVIPGIDNLVTAVNDRTDYEAKVSIELLPGFESTTNAVQNFSINPMRDGGTTSIVVTNPLPSIPASALTPLSFTYYDQYNFTGVQSAVIADLSKPEAGGNSNVITNTGVTTATKGLVTGARVRVLDTEQWLTTTNYYDEKGRVIQTIADNISGGKSVNTMLYNFTGQVVSTYLRHTNLRSQQHPQATILTINVYDDAGRVQSVKKRLNDNASLERTIAANTYDERGQLIGKKLGINGTAPALEEMTFDYNIRGWLKGISKDYLDGKAVNAHFAQDLSYDDEFKEVALNGNIAGVRWKGWNDKTLRAFGYKYDKANRLIHGAYSQPNGTKWDNSAADFTVRWINYDANGNITKMAQQGMEGTAIQPIDRLAYTYRANSNKLAAVYDTSTVTSPLGDFKNGQNGGDDYDYDVMGNLVSDLNKNISSITYNHLNLPVQIDITQKGTISYLYDATGNKLKKTVVDKTVTPVKTTITDYITGFVYRNDSLEMIPHEEGKIRYVTKAGQTPIYIYDYFVKDHLGNTRLVLTENSDVNIYTATMETAVAAKETALFSNIAETRADKPVGYPSADAENKSVSKLSAKQGGKKIGPSIVLRVMAGDTIQLGAKAFYKSTGPAGKNAGTAPVESMLADLVQAFGGKEVGDGTHAITQGADGTPFNANFYENDYRLLKEKNQDNGIAGRPKAYLNFVLFDDKFKLVQENSGVKQVQAVPDQLQELGQDKMVMAQSGFLYVYTSNETEQEVFFDNLVVTQAAGPVLEETHYYPFGLTMAGISSNALKGANYPENKYKYNKGSELQNQEFSDGSGLDWYATSLRSLDPQLGRWWQVDSKTDDAYESVSPYCVMNNDPVRYNDPNGDEGQEVNGNPTAAAKIFRNTQKVAGGVEIVLGGPENPLADIGALAVEVVGGAWSLGELIFGESPVMERPQTPVSPPNNPSSQSAPGGFWTPSALSAPKGTTTPKVPFTLSAGALTEGAAADQKTKGLPQPGKGKGSTPPAQRDPKRVWTKKERQEQLEKQQDGKCAQCDEPKTVDETNGHHIVRHADGGKTTSDNHAEVCHDCHVKLHS